jgi:hypothetical protein
MAWSSLNDVEQKAVAMEIEIARMREASQSQQESSEDKAREGFKYRRNPDGKSGIDLTGSGFVTFRNVHLDDEGVSSSPNELG